jgi:predicted hydrolase (HD superfamily)
MPLPTRPEAKLLLEKYVQDNYQRFHAIMVATAMEGYAKKLDQDPELWFLTGYLHDLDYDQYPTEHPGPSLEWFKEWNYPPELIQAVLAHANGFNGYTTPAASQLDKALIACDEICGIFYAYQKLNPIPFSEMKAKSIKKRLKEGRFAPGIDRVHISNGVADIGITIDEHVDNLIVFLSDLDSPVLHS